MCSGDHFPNLIVSSVVHNFPVSQKIVKKQTPVKNNTAPPKLAMVVKYETRSLYCVECPQYGIRLEALVSLNLTICVS